MSVSLIWAQSGGPHPVIGRDGGIPWHVPEDFARFKALTLGYPVLLGRATWDSLPRRPLPGRRNLVLSRTVRALDGAEVVGDVQAALAGSADVWVIGGAAVYAACLPLADRVEITDVDVSLDVRPGDVLAPALPVGWDCEVGPWQVSRTGVRYRFRSCTR